MKRPEIAVLLSTYERPCHLQRSLLSLALQRGVSGQMEVIVTDDGSGAKNWKIVRQFSDQVDFRVRLTTHCHDGFRLARCRNEGVAVSQAPYLLFSDGDCVFPPDHIQWHLRYRRAGRVVAGDCYRLDHETSERITEATLSSGEYRGWVSLSERRRIMGKAVRGWCYHLAGCKMLPRLTGNNIAIWRSDYERVNGFDENYVGWGLEDRDLQLRLSRIGLRFKSILGRTAAYHLWHPPAPSFARNGIGTQNLTYYQRQNLPTRCAFGLLERIQEIGLVMQNQKVFFVGDRLRDEGNIDSVADFPELLPLRERVALEQIPLRKAA